VAGFASKVTGQFRIGFAAGCLAVAMSRRNDLGYAFVRPLAQ